MRELFDSADASEGALLQRPVIEGAHPFLSCDQTMAELTGSLLHPDFVQALDRTDNAEYRFPRERKPFRHQLDAWSQLLKPGKPQSVLVSSGTGSGKTECFLFPILSDLARQIQPNNARLEGVQAIMLYPLNALIESQRMRLSAWTKPFRGKIRYCLYNGDLEQNTPVSEQRLRPEEVPDRVELRRSPPPILVTNITMLEYMLARADDRPIVEKSKGKLKWIVLDEAHSLVGAAAAEIALLLRRVLMAFDVKPAEVHFVATSATIGDGENVRGQLKRFLADVGGIPDAQVHVIEGTRRMPVRPGGSAKPLPKNIALADPNELYGALASRDDIWRLVERLYQGAVSIDEFEAAAKAQGLAAEELALALSRATRIDPRTHEVERLAPIRIHAFERAVPGIWGCINPECQHATLEWPYGGIFAQRADQCPHCLAPVLEIINCTSCGEPFLEGLEKGGRLTTPVRTPPRDEFEFDSDAYPAADDDADPDDAQPDAADSLGLDRLFAARPSPSARPFFLDRKDWAVCDQATEATLAVLSDEKRGGACPCCGKGPTRESPRVLRPLRFGAPFMIGNAAPLLLEGVEATPLPHAGVRMPSGGRRLLSFTDSRQGTARMAAKLQIESERNFVRSFVYHAVQKSMHAGTGATVEAESVRSEIASLESILNDESRSIIEPIIKQKRAALEKLIGGGTDGIEWDDLVDNLSRSIEVDEWIKDVWQGRDIDPALFADSRNLAEFLLLREFARRPRAANSIETLGLARLRFPYIDSRGEGDLPRPFRDRNKTAADWQSYLSAVLTFFVRANSAIAVKRQTQFWLLPKAPVKTLTGPGKDVSAERNSLGWPQAAGKGRRPRPVSLLVEGLSLNLADPTHRDDLEECLDRAWRDIQPCLADDPRGLSFRKAFVAPVTEGFLCPVTRRVLDAAPFGLTPYGLDQLDAGLKRATAIQMPRHPLPGEDPIGREEARAKIDEWLNADKTIVRLRELAYWNNLSDRIAFFADYARAAEHSAQQPSKRLRRYEGEFKDGRINVLNCSTTMEMGVDIGSVSSVMMTNVPPSIASYRQRVGRAGRRNQATSLAFTFCKDRPLDREAFREPEKFLQRAMAAPKVALNSRPIVQRHVNAFLLSAFIHSLRGDALRMTIGAFFGCPADPSMNRTLKAERSSALFAGWLDKPSTRQLTMESINTITRRSVLDGDVTLVDEALVALDTVEKRFLEEWEGLRLMAREEGIQEAGRTRMGIELQRHCDEFLLSGLADRGFLPGHGFPSDVVTFIPARQSGKESDHSTRDGRRQFRSLGPQRSLDLAIRDYAPGSEVVIDGLVHKSAGVTLNWKRPANEDNLVEVQSLRQHWRCLDCGTAETRSGRKSDSCADCGSRSIERSKYIRPAGFTVDSRTVAHAETDIVDYVKPQEPVVSARNAPWRGLPDPSSGRYRSSRDGLVFYSNKGPTAHGYAICLHCGRAEAEMAPEPNSPLPGRMAGHLPLRRRKGDLSDICAGNDLTWKIQRHFALGHEITTDVVEIQLAQNCTRAVATALIIAIREALAHELGVEADEMGFAATESTNAASGKSVSLLLFDRASGGAGFSVALEQHLAAVLRGAEDILDCATPGCIHACSSCVLTGDAPDGVDALDRTGAYIFLKTFLRIPEILISDDLFVPGAIISTGIYDEIDSTLRATAATQLTLFLHGAFDPADLVDWQGANQLSKWTSSGRKISIGLPRNAVASMDDASRLVLRDFAVRHGISLMEVDPPRFPNGAAPIAAIEASLAPTHLWVSRDRTAARLGRGWGDPLDHPIARAAYDLTLDKSELDDRLFLPAQGAEFVEIDSELDVTVAEFGKTAAAMLRAKLRNCGAWRDEPIERICYEDPFVLSPLVTRLLIDTVAELGLGSDGSLRLSIETRAPKPYDAGKFPFQLAQDWPDPGIQTATILAYGSLRNVKVDIAHKNVPHGRFMTICFSSGLEAKVIFDQGFGAWAIAHGIRVRHDFTAPAPAQAEQMFHGSYVLARRGVGKTYLVCNRGKTVSIK
ncbi:DEAD/DEAH box helicase [Mesorhizobium sp. M0579]|uniref:DEAD/DEAH box helicase n=1 Tax=Mesorhizobium sp. M0579 TaxID=2956962 RepID=UPI003338E538